MLAARRDDLGPDNGRPRLMAEEVAALSRVERSLFASDQDSFDVALGAALGIELETIWQIMDDPRGEPLGAGARGDRRLAGICRTGLHPERTGDRPFRHGGPNLTALVERMPMRTARRLVTAMTHESGKPRRRPTRPVEDGAKPRRQEQDPRVLHAEIAPLQRRLMGGRGR